MLSSGVVHKKLITGLFLALFAWQASWAQINSATADHTDTIRYPVNPGEDLLFVFYQVNRVPKAGSLTAALPGPGNYDFEWRRYNPSIPGLDAPFATETGVSSSTISDLEEGGYQVRIRDGSGTDTTFLAWVMLDEFRAEVEKEADGTLPVYKRRCEFVSISGFVYPDTLLYYDPVSHEALSQTIGYRFKWTSDNDELKIPYDTVLLHPNISYLPPYEDTWYILTATDNLGMVEVDSVFYESIQTKASFRVEYLDKVLETTNPDNMWDPDLPSDWSADQGSTDAKLTVRFINESKNGATYEWVFLDTLGGTKQSEITNDEETITEFTYEQADEYYYPYLVSTSEEDCIDTFRLEDPIFVVPSQLVIPNVFTPNDDGINDKFVFKHQSLRSCKVTIVDRAGKIVYRRKIDDIYAWEGWDGNMHTSDRRAPEGQYYYIVEATGYDGMEYKDPNIIERWKLNRGNKSPGSGTGGTAPPGGGEPSGASQTMYTGWVYLFRHTGTY